MPLPLGRHSHHRVGLGQAPHVENILCSRQPLRSPSYSQTGTRDGRDAVGPKEQGVCPGGGGGQSGSPYQDGTVQSSQRSPVAPKPLSGATEKHEDRRRGRERCLGKRRQPPLQPGPAPALARCGFSLRPRSKGDGMARFLLAQEMMAQPPAAAAPPSPTKPPPDSHASITLRPPIIPPNVHPTATQPPLPSSQDTMTPPPGTKR